ncbi:MAG: hypothetical protein JSV49_09350 [Thermoplasmata archaeon]|nr:MAG: hypothetical protein JSV49_09350 [Thermoplasmata archaeon]
MLRIVFLFVVIINAIMHLRGLLRSFNISESHHLLQAILKMSGFLWFLVFILFIIVLLLFLLKQNYWWITAALAIILSLILMIHNWSNAELGRRIIVGIIILNLIIIFPVISACASTLPSSFPNRYKSEVQDRLEPLDNIPILNETDIRHLPEPVKKYLNYTGAIGKPKVINFRLEANGKMKRNEGSGWLDVTAEQYNFYNDYARFFYIKSSLYGIPFDGLHKYVGNKATMQIKIASLITVVDAKGKEMDQSDTVTFFNDMCVFAPATLIDKNIQWEQVDSLTVNAKFTNQDIEINATLYFNEKGEMVNFVTDYRYLSEDGDKYKKYKWSTPVRNYKDFNGRKIPTYGEAIWHTPDGDFTYFKLDLKDIKYNVEKYYGVNA